MQQIIWYIRSVLFGLEDDELLMTMGVESANVDSFNSLLSDCRKIVRISSTNRYYLSVTSECIKENISGDIGTLYDCYVG